MSLRTCINPRNGGASIFLLFTIIASVISVPTAIYFGTRPPIEVEVEVEVPVEVPYDRLDNITINAQASDINFINKSMITTELNDNLLPINQYRELEYLAYDNVSADLYFNIYNIEIQNYTIIHDPYNTNNHEYSDGISSTNKVFIQIEVSDQSFLRSISFTGYELGTYTLQVDVYRSENDIPTTYVCENYGSINIDDSVGNIITRTLYRPDDVIISNGKYFIAFSVIESGEEYYLCYTEENNYLDYSFQDSIYSTKAFDYALNITTYTDQSIEDIISTIIINPLSSHFASPTDLGFNQYNLNNINLDDVDTIVIDIYWRSMNITFGIDIHIYLYTETYFTLQSVKSISEIIIGTEKPEYSSVYYTFLSDSSSPIILFTTTPQIVNKILFSIDDEKYYVLDIDNFGLLVNYTYNIEIIEMNITINCIGGYNFVETCNMNYIITSTSPSGSIYEEEKNLFLIYTSNDIEYFMDYL